MKRQVVACMLAALAGTAAVASDESLATPATASSAAATEQRFLAEGSYPATPGQDAAIARSRADVQGDLQRWIAAGSPDVQRGESTAVFVAPAAGPALSRAEVIADLEIWMQAGLSTLDLPDPFNEVQASRVARYAQLRNGPEYAQRVRQIAAERDGMPGLAAAGSPAVSR